MISQRLILNAYECIDLPNIIIHIKFILHNITRFIFAIKNSNLKFEKSN